MGRLVTPPRRGTSPSRGTPPPCEQALIPPIVNGTNFDLVVLDAAINLHLGWGLNQYLLPQEAVVLPRVVAIKKKKKTHYLLFFIRLVFPYILLRIIYKRML